MKWFGKEWDWYDANFYGGRKLKWFSKDWDGDDDDYDGDLGLDPYYDLGYHVATKHVATPVGQLCAWCDEAFVEGDEGLFVWPLRDDELDVDDVDVPLRHNCYMRMVNGSIVHQLKRWGHLGSILHQLELCHCWNKGGDPRSIRPMLVQHGDRPCWYDEAGSCKCRG